MSRSAVALSVRAPGRSAGIASSCLSAAARWDRLPTTLPRSCQMLPLRGDKHAGALNRRPEALHLNQLDTHQSSSATMEKLLSMIRSAFEPSRKQVLNTEEISRTASDVERLAASSEMRGVSSPVFRKHAALRMRAECERLDRLGEGRLVFDSTETWRTVYEEVLSACKAKRYLSVAVIRSDDYWRDPPGERSLEFNFQLVDHGFTVHRIFIIDDFFWPQAARTPSTILFQWIQSQRIRGVDVSLVRLSALEQEPMLVRDMGIYGTDAVGYQQTDFEGRTTRYEMSFQRAAIRRPRRLGPNCSFMPSRLTKLWSWTDVDGGTTLSSDRS